MASDADHGKLIKFYKIITPESSRTSVGSSQDILGDHGLYGNYSWVHKLLQGSTVRLQRYREFDMMDEDTDVNRALDIITEEIVGNNPKAELPMLVKITAGEEQEIASRIVVTLNAALKTWCNIHRWNRRLYHTVRNTIKYGDAFFFRNKSNNLPFIFCHPKNVVGAIVSKDDVTDVKGWQIRSDYKKAVQNVNYTLTSTAESYNVENYATAEIIRFGLHDDMSDEAPFSRSLLAAAYKVFKQKQMLEDSILIYRISRAPEKRVFKIELGNTPPHLRTQILENAKNEIKQRKIPSFGGGGNGEQMDSIYSPISQNEDFFFSMKNGAGSTVETLPGGTLGNGEDANLQYFYHKMWRALRIPQSYMDNSTEGGTIFNDGKVGIAYQQEIKFTLFIESLQVHFEDVLDREFKKFLLDQHINIDPTIFKIVLPEPSNYKQSRENEMDQALVNLATTAMGIDWLSRRFIGTKYLQLTKNEMIINDRMKREELGLDPNGGIRDMAKVYSPENADSGGFDGGLTSGSSNLGVDGGSIDSTDEELDTGDGSEFNAENELNKPSNGEVVTPPNSKNVQSTENPQ